MLWNEFEKLFIVHKCATEKVELTKHYLLYIEG